MIVHWWLLGSSVTWVDVNVLTLSSQGLRDPPICLLVRMKFRYCRRFLCRIKLDIFTRMALLGPRLYCR